MVKAQHAPTYRPVPALLRELREEAGLTQRQLGERLGRPQSWIYNSETGNRRVDLGEFVDWCVACGIAPAKGLERFLRERK